MSNVDKFYTLYEKLEENEELEKKYRELVTLFDYFLSNDWGFWNEIRKFDNKRHDETTSDREVLAYMLMKLGVNLNKRKRD